jgi:hypothetical protein
VAQGPQETVAQWKTRLEAEIDKIERELFRGKATEARKRELQARLAEYEDQLHEINRRKSRPAQRRQGVKKRGRSQQTYDAATLREDLGQGDHRTTTTTRTTTTVRKGKRPITERSSQSTSMPLDDTDDTDDSSLWGSGRQRGGAVHALIETLRKKYKKNHVVRSRPNRRRWG